MEFIFYKISCIDSSITDFYIGSTRDFTRRKSQHKHCCHNENTVASKYKIYQIIRSNGGWTNWQMEPIDKQTFNSKLDARIYERKLTEQYNSSLNTIKAFSSVAEKIEQKKQLCKQWRIDNKDYHKQYYAIRKAQQSESKSESES